MKHHTMKLRYLISIAIAAILFLSAELNAQVRVVVEQPVVPVLIGKPYNSVLKLDFIKEKSCNAKISQLQFSLDGNVGSVENVALYPAYKNGRIAPENALSSAKKAEKITKFSSPIFLTQDTTTVWVSLTLKEKAKLKDKIMVDCLSAVIDGQPAELQHQSALKALRLGVALRNSKMDNIHTSRIPGIATSKAKTLLAIYDARYEYSRDLQGNIDIALNRSFDGGATWQPTQIVLDQKNWGNLP